MDTTLITDTHTESLVWKRMTKRGLYGAIVVFTAFMVLLALVTHGKPDSFNELSRLAAIESLVERGTWTITDSDKTGDMADKAFWNGEFYSDKTPVFTAMTAVPYYFFYHGMGAEIDSGNCGENDPVCSYWWFSYLMVGIPAAATLALLYFAGRQLGVGAFSAFMMTAALGLGTMVLPFSTVYNSHIPAAAYVFVSFIGLLLPGLSDRHRRMAMAVSGLFAGLTLAVDLPSLFIVMALGVLALARYPRHFFWFGGAALIPLSLTAIFNYQMHQSVMPIYFRPGAYVWEGSPWIDAVAGRHRPEVKDWALRTFNTIVGDHGILVAWPVIIFPLVGLLRQTVYRGSAYRREASVVLGAIGLQLASFLFAIDGFGGRAYGIRYLISFFPLLFFFAYFAVPVKSSILKSGAYWLSFLLALVLSCASTFEGAATPWSGWRPVLFLETMEVRPYVRLASPLNWRPHHPLEAEIGPGVTLVGYNLAPQPSRPSDKVSLSTFWRSTQMPAGSQIKVFVHLRNPEGRNVVQADHGILEDYATPVSQWERLVAEGPMLRDDTLLDLPRDLSPGTYKIWVGLYNPEKPARVPVVNDRSGENAVYLGDLVIVE